MKLLKRLDLFVALMLFFLLGFAYAQGTDRHRFEVTQTIIELGAGPNVSAPFWMNVARDKVTESITYILTRTDESGTLKVVGISSIPGTVRVPSPEPSGSPSPTPTPLPSPPSCGSEWGASLSVSVALQPDLAIATYTADWIEPPSEGWFSDNAIPLHQGPIGRLQPRVELYPRGAEDYLMFGFLQLHMDAAYCEQRVDFTIPRQ